MKNIDEQLVKEEKFIQPLLEVVRDKRGLSHAMKFSREYILNFLIERGVLSGERQTLINELRTNTNYEPREVMELVNSYYKWRETLPEFNLEINRKLDSASEKYGTTFEKVGNKILGIVEKGNRKVCVDVSGRIEKELAEINNQGIEWKNNQISTPEMRWIVENTKYRMGILL